MRSFKHKRQFTCYQLTDLIVTCVRNIYAVYLDDLVADCELAVLLSGSHLCDLGHEEAVCPLSVGRRPEPPGNGEAKAGVVPQQSGVDLLYLDHEILPVLTQCL